MSIDVPVALVIAAVVSSAMAAAASLDQSVKQLPTRRRIGAVAYSRYSMVADARNGLFWYVPLAITWIPITLGAAMTGWGDHPSQLRALALALVVLGVSAHLIVTGAFAGPALLSQRRVAGDEDALERVFDRFERWQALRAAIDVATLGVAVWALVATMAERNS